jgi:hypothetical protein
VLLWSVSTLLTPVVAASFSLLLLARVALGIGEGLGGGVGAWLVKQGWSCRSAHDLPDPRGKRATRTAIDRLLLSRGGRIDRANRGGRCKSLCACGR